MYTWNFVQATPCPHAHLLRTALIAVLFSLPLSGYAVEAALDSNVVSPESTLVVVQADDSLTLNEAVALTLKHNAHLETFSWDLRIGDARILQAGLRPNPELEFEIEDISLGGGPDQQTSSMSFSGAAPVVNWERGKEADDDSVFGRAELTLSLSQRIEMGGKRVKRIAVAREDKALVQWDYETARADVIAGVAQAFVSVLVAQEERELQQELNRLAEDVTRTIAARVDAGKVSPLENNRAEVALASVRIALDTATRELAAARLMLAAYWGAGEAHFERADGALDTIESIPSMAVLAEEINTNPDMARWATEIAQREAVVALERSQRKVDPTLTLGFKSVGVDGSRGSNYGIGTDGSFSVSRSRGSFGSGRENSLLLGFSVPLPLFNRNQGNIAEAHHRLAKATVERRRATGDIYTALARARQGALSAYEAVSRLKEEVLPKADETFEKTQRGYREGKFSYLEVLNAQQTLFDARTSYLGALARYHEASVAIERLTGRSLSQWNTDTTKSEDSPNA